MDKGIKTLRIMGWILLVLAGYSCLALRTVYCTTAADVLKAVIYDCGPVLLLLAGLILSIPRHTSLHLAALGLVIAAGVTYVLLLPKMFGLASFLPAPQIFPFNLLPESFLWKYLSIKSYMSSGLHVLFKPLYRPLYLLGTLLLMVAAVLDVRQSRKRREVQPVEQREGAYQF